MAFEIERLASGQELNWHQRGRKRKVPAEQMADREAMAAAMAILNAIACRSSVAPTCVTRVSVLLADISEKGDEPHPHHPDCIGDRIPGSVNDDVGL